MLKTRLPVIFLSLLFILLATACDSLPTPGSERDLQEEIHNYFYANKTLSKPEDFVAWANKNLADYSDREIYRALYKDAADHAEQGHPNAVSKISYCALAWTAEKGLEYKKGDWQDLREKALTNERVAPTGELQLWPTPKP